MRERERESGRWREWKKRKKSVWVKINEHKNGNKVKWIDFKLKQQNEIILNFNFYYRLITVHKWRWWALNWIALL